MGIRVCHLSDIHKLDDTRIVLKECASLAQAGYEVHVIAVGESGMFGDVHLHGITAPSRLKRYFGSQKALLDMAIAIDAQVYHLHDPELLRIVKPLKKRTGAKIVFDSHEDYKIQLAGKNIAPVRFFMRLWYTTIQSKAKNYLDGFIFPCENKRLSQEICPLTLTTVDNYPLLSWQTAVNDLVKKKDTVCYVGSISRGRGIVQAIKAVHAAGARLELAGKFSDSTPMEEIALMPEWSCVNYNGVLSHAETMELVASCEVGLCCLSNEGQYGNAKNLATKVLEYFLNHVPVMLNNTAYNNELNNHYHFAEIVDNINDIDIYASKIRMLLSDSNWRKKLSDNGYNYVKNVANWEAEVKKLLGLYEEILK